MANLTTFVNYQEFSDVTDDGDYTLWRDENFDLIVRFNLIPETKQLGLAQNFFITSFAINSTRYGKHGFPLQRAESVVSFLKPQKIASLKSLPEGLQGDILESKIFSFNGCKVIVTECNLRNLVNYFDFKIILGEFFIPKNVCGILGQHLTSSENWSRNEEYRVG